MDDQELLQMMVVEPWERYRRADRREKLALLRHSFSMYIFRCILTMLTKRMRTCILFWMVIRS